MRKLLSVLLIVIILMFTFVSCGYEISIKKKTNEKIRTTITKEEWDKTMQMDNYTITIRMSEDPEWFEIDWVTATASKYNASGNIYYLVNEDGHFYYLYTKEDVWYKRTGNVGDSHLLFKNHYGYYNISDEFENLSYDANSETYKRHTVDKDINYYYEYSFENGVLVWFRINIKMIDILEIIYYVTDIGTTTVEVPQYQ